MSNTDEGAVVSVTEKGQATIPKSIREKLGISAPGRVRWVYDEERDEVHIRPVEPLSDFKGIIDSDKSARELLDEAREADEERERDLLRAAGVDEEDEEDDK